MNVYIIIGMIFCLIGMILFILHYSIIKSIELCSENINYFREKANEIYSENAKKNYEPQIIYSDRPSNTFKKMFLEPTIWLGYQEM